VTARREAENKLSDTLRELERANAIQKEYLILASDERARLNALLNAMQVGILFVDRNNRVIYSNPAFEQVWLLTRSKTRFIGMDAAALLVQTTERLSRGGEALQDLLRLAKDGEPSSPMEIGMSDGRLIMRVGYPVRDSTEQLVGYLWLFEDVTHELAVTVDAFAPVTPGALAADRNGVLIDLPGGLTLAPSGVEPPAGNAYEYRLVVGRKLYDAGRTVSASASLAHLAAGARLHLHPLDAERLGAREGSTVKVTSPRTTLTLEVQPDPAIARSTVWVAFNQSNAAAAELIDADAWAIDVKVESL